MFKRVGNEIRIWAKVFVILEMIPIVGGGIVACLAMYDMSEDYLVLGILAAIAIIVVGYFLARLSAILLYSWGELLVRVTSIDEKLTAIQKAMDDSGEPYAPPVYVPAAPIKTIAEQKAEKAPAPAAPVEPAAPVDDAWLCPTCGKKNVAEGNWCENCGAKRIG